MVLQPVLLMKMEELFPRGLSEARPDPAAAASGVGVMSMEHGRDL